MTEQYERFMYYQALRDQNIVILAGLALGFVVSWLTVPAIPVPAMWQERIKTLYQVGGLLIYLAIVAAGLLGYLG